MAYDLDTLTDGCYEGTTCLINKFGIRDSVMLAEMEAAITFAKSAELERNPISGAFDFEHYKAVHKFLFEDIYDWAGTVRTVDISKKGTIFVPACEIESIAGNCFDRLKMQNYFLDYPPDKFCNTIVDFYCVINMLHPFRDGNVTQRHQQKAA